MSYTSYIIQIKKLIIITLGLIVSLSILLSHSALKAKPDEKNNPQQNVTQREITTGISLKNSQDMVVESSIESSGPAEHASLLYKGKWVPEQELTLFSPFSGRVEEIIKHPGQDVEENEAILKLSTDEAMSKFIELQQEEIKLKQKLKGFELNNQNLEWLKLSNQFSKAQDDANRTQKRYEDSETLYKKGIISRVEFDNDKKHHQESQLYLQELKLSMSHFKEERSPQMKEVTKSSLKLVMKKKSDLQKSLQDATLKAPKAGKLKKLPKNDKQIRIGTQLANGEALYILESAIPQIEIKLTEFEVKDIRVGTKASLGDEGWDASVLSIESIESEQAHQPLSFKVLLALHPEIIDKVHVRMGTSVPVKFYKLTHSEPIPVTSSIVEPSKASG